jgi:hypothetical protein
MSRHGVSVHSDKPRRASRSTAFGNVLQNGDRLLERELQPLNGRSLPLREDALARLAVDHPDRTLVPAPALKAQVPDATLAQIGAAFVPAAEVFDPRSDVVLLAPDGRLHS